MNTCRKHFVLRNYAPKSSVERAIRLLTVPSTAYEIFVIVN